MEDYLSKISKPLKEDVQGGENKEPVEGAETKEPVEKTGGEPAPKKEPEKNPDVRVDGNGLEEFTKKLGVQSLDEVESRFKEYDTIKTNLGTLESEKQSLTDELAKYKAFVDEAVDPMSYFANEESFFVNTLKKKYPDLGLDTAAKLVSQDVKDMDDFDAMVLSEVVKHSDIGLREDEAEAKVLKRLGIESRDDINDMSATDRKLMRVEAKESKALLAREQEAAKEKPERKTPADFFTEHQKTKEQLQEQTRKAYEPIVDSIVEQVKEVLKEGEEELFKIDPDETYMKELKEYAMDGAVRRMLDTSDESRKEVLQNIRAKFWADNAAKVLKAYETTLRSKWQAEVDAKFANHQEVGIQKEKDVTVEKKNSYMDEMTVGTPKTSWG